MHDCLEMESRLIDLVFDELETDAKLSLLAELETCEGCLSEYRSMTGALNLFDQAAVTVLPDETYWPAHRAARREQLEEPLVVSAGKEARRDPLWKRIFAARLPVPAPLAAAIVLALMVSSALALRTSTEKTAAAIQPPVVTTTMATTAAPQPSVIEVPVYRERVVTRTVYVEKREKKEARPSAPVALCDGESPASSSPERESVQGGFFTRANLTDFQPPDEMKIRVIKRSNTDEN
jgi:hypothetical protein